jgi:peptidoglycan hydrolase-like protein with peptidoglycan-binding domain
VLRNFLFSILLVAPFLAAGPKAVAQKSAPKEAPAASSGKSAQNTSPKRTARRRPARRRTARVPAGSQRQPSRDRYKEIQQALSNAGFDPGPVDGVWGPNSEDALADFQEARGLEPTGRIDAQTLIQLGLGPNYETANSSTETPNNNSGTAR